MAANRNAGEEHECCGHTDGMGKVQPVCRRESEDGTIEFDTGEVIENFVVFDNVER
jgi:hypothetical protein